VLNNQRRAQDLWDKARGYLNAKYFGDLAEQYSIEAGSRTLRGEVPPNCINPQAATAFLKRLESRRG